MASPPFTSSGMVRVTNIEHTHTSLTMQIRIQLAIQNNIFNHKGKQHVVAEIDQTKLNIHHKKYSFVWQTTTEESVSFDFSLCRWPATHNIQWAPAQATVGEIYSVFPLSSFVYFHFAFHILILITAWCWANLCLSSNIGSALGYLPNQEIQNIYSTGPPHFQY